MVLRRRHLSLKRPCARPQIRENPTRTIISRAARTATKKPCVRRRRPLTVILSRQEAWCCSSAGVPGLRPSWAACRVASLDSAAGQILAARTPTLRLRLASRFVSRLILPRRARSASARLIFLGQFVEDLASILGCRVRGLRARCRRHPGKSSDHGLKFRLPQPRRSREKRFFRFDDAFESWSGTDEPKSERSMSAPRLTRGCVPWEPRPNGTHPCSN